MILTFDVETKHWAQEFPGGFDEPEKFGISCVCCRIQERGYSVEQVYPAFPLNNFATKYTLMTRNCFAALLDEAETIVSFNGRNFDFRVLEGEGFKLNPNWDTKHFDILDEFYKKMGFRVSLDSFAEHNLGEKKILDGRAAVALWKAIEQTRTFASLQEVSVNLMSNIINYCFDDVRKTELLYGIIQTTGRLRYLNKQTGFVEATILR